MLKRIVVAGAAFALLGATLMPTASAAPRAVDPVVGAPAGVDALVDAAAGLQSSPAPDLASRIQKAKKDRENQVTQAERSLAAKKSGIKAPTISAGTLEAFKANQEALAGTGNKGKVGGVTPHYFGPFANYANSPQHLPVAIVTFPTPPFAPNRPAAGYAVVNDAGTITEIVVTDPGAGYDPAVPTVDVTITDVSHDPDAPFAQAYASASVGTVLDRVDIVSGGEGYNDPATLTFSGGTFDTVKFPNWREASGSVALDPNGKITAVNVTDFGEGYTQLGTVTVTDDVNQFTPAVLTPVKATGVTGVTVTGGGLGYVLPGIKKFVDELPTLGFINDPTKTKTNLGQYLAIGVADQGSYPGSDFYEIAVVQYKMKMHSDLPATLLRGYVQLTSATTPGAVPLFNTLKDGTQVPAMIPAFKGVPAHQAYGYDTPQYLGPILAAHKDRPVRVLFRNLLPTGIDGDLFLPVDTTVMGSGVTMSMDQTATNNYGFGTDPYNPVCGTENVVKPKNAKGESECYTENRATPHLHGGATPWISDGTPHQWITPAGEDTTYPEGVSVKNVPDMPNPGPGAMTFFYTNQQSSRLMFYHDHAWGITRLNVYAGEAAGYDIRDDSVDELQENGVIPDDNHTWPLIIQDKTFVPTDYELSVADPLWNKAAWGGKGNLWLPHTYMPAQNPWDTTGTNQFGRWAYGPWFWPPTTTIMFPPRPNPYKNTCDALIDWCEPASWIEIPAVPNESMGMEAFADTPMVNGTAYPKTTVDPRAYRFKILNAANDRFWNLQLYEAVGTNAPGTPDNCNPGTGENCTEVALNESEVATAKTDPFVMPTPDTFRSKPGPVWNMIGTESGWLAQPTTIPHQVTTWVTDPTVFNAGNVKDHSLLLGPAQRADVVVDFTKYAGKTLILYNDAPAAFPARDPRYDYYTDNADLRDSGGANTTPPGYGPNTRTIMQITVSNNTCTPKAGDLTATPKILPNTCTFSLTKANKWWTSTKLGGQGLFERWQPPIVVGQAAYNRAYGTAFGTQPTTPNDGFVRIQDDVITFTTLPAKANGVYDASAGAPGYGATIVSMKLGAKAMHDEMGASWDNMFGRMSGNLGLEAPNNKPGLAQNLVLYPFTNPPTETFDGLSLAVGTYNNETAIPVVTASDGTQIWKITHNGVDSHPIHFHFSDVQLLNRVGWDGIIRPPEASEVGWQDTVRVSPLEDTIVAMRPIVPQTPFGIPASKRLLNPTLPENSPDGFVSLDPDGNAITPAYTNVKYDFDWEYVWHCHILSHEEMDMMRPIAVKVKVDVPGAPTELALAFANGANLTWKDATPATANATWGDKTNEVGYRIMRAPVTTTGSGSTLKYNVGTFTEAGTALANATTWTDPGGAPLAYVYKVVAWNAAGETASGEVGLPKAPDVPGSLAATATGRSVTLTWSTPADGGSPITGYVISRQGSGTTTNVAAGATTSTFTNLNAGQTYNYSIVAVNAIGSSASGAFPAVTIATVPGTPRAFVATGGTRLATLTWNSPVSNGGDPIASYYVSWGTSSAATGSGTQTIKVPGPGVTGTVATVVSTAPDGTVSYSFRLTGLARGSFFFKIAAVNGIGQSTTPATSSRVTVN
jgi:FtsP/CotA-like multicopper oxidase with cupredoxin domain